MINLFFNLFSKYGHCRKHPKKGTLGYEWALSCNLDNSFDFLLKENNHVPDDQLFYSFLAGYSDAEGWFGIRKSHFDKISFIFELQTTDEKILRQIKLNLEKRGFHPRFGIKHRETRDICYLRILRKKELISLIKNLLPHSSHEEKIQKMQLILQIKDKNSWNEIKYRVKDLKDKIKKEVESCSYEAKKLTNK